MFITTFYSYKGGVGRTMALVNVGADLARSGKRVLLVDFDLEAPSLPNYGSFNACARKQGLVDYVASYRKNGIAPDVSDFMYRCEHNDTPIWVMPAGDAATTSYSQKLASIDWNILYKNEKGYLFFEDMKQQWEYFEGRGFDYVLIDSRTGHTDVGGICTRQLPDLVVAMFLPTMQNISGLKPIVNEIRCDRSRLERPVNISFCASNVPKLDDEQFVLANLFGQAAEELEYDPKTLKIVHHYNSLDVLSHSIFALDRPNTSLAKEYTELRQSITAQNLSDADGATIALSVIRDEFRRTRNRRSPARDDLIKRIDKIFSLHDKDPAIAFLVAGVRSSMGDIEGEIQALTAAIENGDVSTSVRAHRARAYQAMNMASEASRDVGYILDHEQSSGVEITAALQMLQGSTDIYLASMAKLLKRDDLSLSALNSMADFVQRDRRFLSRFADRLIYEMQAEDESSSEIEAARANAVLALIGCGRFKEAIDVLAASNRDGFDSIVDHFNYFVARWGEQGSPDLKMASELRIRMAVREEYRGPNFLQCNALVEALDGNVGSALQMLTSARLRAQERKVRVFSCVSYLYMLPEAFSEDCVRLADELKSGGVCLKFDEHLLLASLQFH